MTIASENRKSGPYTGTGFVTTYPFDFKILQLSDLVVTVADELGVESVPVLDSDYSIELNEDQNSDPGGIVILDIPLPLGHVLVATSNVPATQGTNLSNQGGFYPAVVTDALDRLTILIQQLKVDVARSAKLPITRGEEIDELLAALVLVADNLTEITAIGVAIPAINAVGSIADEVTQVAGVASDIPTVAAIANEVQQVAAIDLQVALLADISAAIVALADVAASIPPVAAIDDEVAAVGANIVDVVAVAGALADIAAAVAALPDLALKASLTGATFTGPVEVPANAAGSQVARSSETIRNVGGAARIPSWNTAGRPGAPSVGDSGFNTTLGTMETWGGAAWIQSGRVAVRSAVVTPSGGSFSLPTFDSSIYKRVVLVLSDLSMSNTTTLEVRVAGAGATITYAGSVVRLTSGGATNNTANPTTGARLWNSGGGMSAAGGECVFQQEDTGIWNARGSILDGSSRCECATRITNTAPIDTISLHAGVGTFTGGSAYLVLFPF